MIHIPYSYCSHSSSSLFTPQLNPVLSRYFRLFMQKVHSYPTCCHYRGSCFSSLHYAALFLSSSSFVPSSCVYIVDSYHSLLPGCLSIRHQLPVHLFNTIFVKSKNRTNWTLSQLLQRGSSPSRHKVQMK